MFSNKLHQPYTGILIFKEGFFIVDNYEVNEAYNNMQYYHNQFIGTSGYKTPSMEYELKIKLHVIKQDNLNINLVIKKQPLIFLHIHNNIIAIFTGLINKNTNINFNNAYMDVEYSLISTKHKMVTTIQ